MTRLFQSELKVHKPQKIKTDKALSRRRRSIVNVWTVLALVVFYVAYTSYSRGDVQTGALLLVIGVLLTYIGLSRGTRYEL